MYRLVLYLSIAAALAARSSRVLCEWLSTLDCRVLTPTFLSFSSFSKEIQENLYDHHLRRNAEWGQRVLFSLVWTLALKHRTTVIQ